MSIADELQRRRHKTSAEGIQRRHRQAQASAQRLAQTLVQHSGPSCVHPAFQAALADAQRQTKAKLNAPVERADLDSVLDKLRTEGKLPPIEKPDNVGYEPTPEEVLGELAVARSSPAPHGTEESPSVDEVLGRGDAAVMPAAPGDDPPSPAASPIPQPPASPGLATGGRAGQTNAKRTRK